MPPLPPVTMKPRAAKGTLDAPANGRNPDKVKAKVPVGTVALVWEYAEPDRNSIPSVSINFRRVESMPHPSKVSEPRAELSTVAGVPDGPSATPPVSDALEKEVATLASLKSSAPLLAVMLPVWSRVKAPTVARGFPFPSVPEKLKAKGPAIELCVRPDVWTSSVPLPLALPSNWVMSPCELFCRTKSKVILLGNGLLAIPIVICPRPSTPTRYWPSLLIEAPNTDVYSGSTMSTVPPVMPPLPPLPLAVKVPTIANGTLLASVPETEKTKVPLRLLLLKLPLGGGWAGAVLLLLQATRSESVESARNRTSALRTDIDCLRGSESNVELAIFSFEVSTGESSCKKPEPRK